MTYDLAIIGGGPAGVAAGVYAARKRLNTIFITKDWNGQSAVSDGIENWIGDTRVSGLDLVKRLETHLKSYSVTNSQTGDGITAGITVKEGEWCKTVEKIAVNAADATGPAAHTLFKITTDKGAYEARTILIASGSHRRKLDVPGADRLEHKGLTYCASCDGPLYSGQDVAVVGGGNAAFESAAQLLAYCKSVTLLNRSDSFRADPVTVEKVLKDPKMTAIKNAAPKEVLGDKFVSSFIYTDLKARSLPQAGSDVTLAVTGIFVEIGSLPNTDMVKGLVDIDAYGRIKADPRTQATSVPGIWSAGDCTDGLYHQNNIAAGDAVKALENIYVFLKAK